LSRWHHNDRIRGGAVIRAFVQVPLVENTVENKGVQSDVDEPEVPAPRKQARTVLR